VTRLRHQCDQNFFHFGLNLSSDFGHHPMNHPNLILGSKTEITISWLLPASLYIYENSPGSTADNFKKPNSTAICEHITASTALWSHKTARVMYYKFFTAVTATISK
jgi:hypothetical protein